MTTARLLPLLAFCGAFGVSASAHAQYLTGDRSRSAAAPDVEVWGYQDVPYEHDRGLFVRGYVGMAHLSTRAYVEPDVDLELRGGALDLQAAVGGIVAPNVALQLTSSAIVALSPAAYVGNEPLESATGGMQLFTVAPGVTWYLPQNAYISPSMGLGILRMRFDDDALNQPEPLLGFAFDLTGGKEWWVGPRFGVGVAGHLSVHTVASDLETPFRGVSIGLGLSMAWN